MIIVLLLTIIWAASVVVAVCAVAGIADRNMNLFRRRGWRSERRGGAASEPHATNSARSCPARAGVARSAHIFRLNPHLLRRYS